MTRIACKALSLNGTATKHRATLKNMALHLKKPQKFSSTRFTSSVMLPPTQLLMVNNVISLLGTLSNNGFC